MTEQNSPQQVTLNVADLEALIAAKVAEGVAAATPQAPEVVVPEDIQAMHDASPWYYTHLADGRVVELQGQATHYTDENGTFAVIGQYPK